MKNTKKMTDAQLESKIAETETALRELQAVRAQRLAEAQQAFKDSLKGLDANERLDASLVRITLMAARQRMTYGIKAAADDKVEAYYTRRAQSGTAATYGLYAKSKNGTIYEYGRKSGVYGDLYRVGKGKPLTTDGYAAMRMRDGG